MLEKIVLHTFLTVFFVINTLDLEPDPQWVDPL
jgi:hypothetical protein